MLDSSCENAADGAVLPEAQHARTDHFSAETTNKQKVVKITVWMALLFKQKGLSSSTSAADRWIFNDTACSSGLNVAGDGVIDVRWS